MLWFCLFDCILDIWLGYFILYIFGLFPIRDHIIPSNMYVSSQEDILCTGKEMCFDISGYKLPDILL